MRVYIIEGEPRLAPVLQREANPLEPAQEYASRDSVQIIESNGIPNSLPVVARNCDLVLLGSELTRQQALELIHCFRNEGKVPIAVTTESDPGAVLPFLEAGASG